MDSGLADTGSLGAFIDGLNIPVTILKREQRNMRLWLNGRSEEIEIESAKNIVDSTGAGDIFNAGFLAKILAGRSAIEAAVFGQELAARCLQHRGALLPASAWSEINQ